MWGIEIFGMIGHIMGDVFIAIFIAIGWVVLAALIQNSGKRPMAQKPGSALSSMAIAGLVVGAVLLVYLGLAAGFR